MTVNSAVTFVVVEGNGIASTFSYNFLIPAAPDVTIFYTDVNGIVTQLINTQYSITGIGNPAGGTVVYPLTGSPIPIGSTLTISRNLPLLQLITISNQGAFYPAVVESALDYLMMAIQQVNARVSGDITFSPISMKQMKQALANIAQIYTVGNLIPADISNTLNIAWYGSTITQGDTMSAFIKSTLGYTDNQMTALFVAASLLPY